MDCRGFETENQAREFGEELRRAAHLAGLSARVGVDAGDPGDDRTQSWLNPELFRGDNPDMRLGPDVHGITIQPDDGNTVFARLGRARGQVRSNAGHFVRSLEQSLPRQNDAPRRDSPPIRRAIRVLNLAEIAEDPIAKLVLAVSTIEGLATDQPWTDGQQELISGAAAWLERAHGDREETTQVIAAIRQMRVGSIRQRIRQLLEANELSSLWPDWDTLYDRRSRLFHGRAKDGCEHRGNHLNESDLHNLGQEAINLCARIVLSMAKREGLAVPGRAKVHFGVDA